MLNYNSLKYKYIFIIIIFMLISFFNISFAEDNYEVNQKIENLQQEIINLVLKNSSSLNSQQKIIDKYHELTYNYSRFTPDMDLKASLGSKIEDNQLKTAPELGINFSLPLLSPDNNAEIIKAELEKFIAEGENIQSLDKMRQNLISDLMLEIKEMMELIHEIKGLNKIINLFSDHKEQLASLIETGMAEPEKMWELDQKIIEKQTELIDSKASSSILINEITNKFGGKQKNDLQLLLKELVDCYKVVNLNEE